MIYFCQLGNQWNTLITKLNKNWRFRIHTFVLSEEAPGSFITLAGHVHHRINTIFRAVQVKYIEENACYLSGATCESISTKKLKKRQWKMFCHNILMTGGLPSTPIAANKPFLTGSCSLHEYQRHHKNILRILFSLITITIFNLAHKTCIQAARWHFDTEVNSTHTSRFCLSSIYE